ncbi:GntR family transcriptional regulator [Nocardiopsis suaedae]|uniref:GntR family transcriptional regulator n=1 Tax=Nocardiopsis suaedae TaxID=3018444 RepID=A0ABT4TPW2_9ACTN|nr:GntR family transcriptional regulator [Nocardiopsis suaedae]MDA2806729.1 GntR family transcriptional regulator [Nocardiopsis suaedae]
MDARIPEGFGPDDELDYDGPEPVWLQLAAVVAARIEAGVYRPRRPIPSAAQPAGEFGVAVNTARKTVDLLVRLGYVRTVTGKGAYVLERGPEGTSSGEE